MISARLSQLEIDMQKDIGSEIKVVGSLLPGIISDASLADGTGVDTAGFQSVVFLLGVGTCGITSATFQMQESDDNSAFTAIADADLEAEAYTTVKSDLTITTDNDINLYRWKYRGTKRYVRVIISANGYQAEETTLPYAGAVILGYPKEQPIADWMISD